MWVNKLERLEVSIAQEELDAAYVMYKAGASFEELSKGFGISVAELSWLLIMYPKLGEYTVHYKDSNQPTV
jgi:hypothetical protein